MEGHGLSENLHDMWQYRLNSRPEPGNETRDTSLHSRPEPGNEASGNVHLHVAQLTTAKSWPHLVFHEVQCSPPDDSRTNTPIHLAANHINVQSFSPLLQLRAGMREDKTALEQISHTQLQLKLLLTQPGCCHAQSVCVPCATLSSSSMLHREPAQS